MLRFLPFVLVSLLAGCSWFESGDTETAAQKAARAQRVTAIQSPVGIAAPQGETMADRRLQDVYERQQALYRRLGSEGRDLRDPEFDRLINEVITEYESYLTDYPNSTYGFILFGKMLRDIGQPVQANVAFLRANRLDENIAVVKQQIGNFMAEEGEPSIAMAYYLSAVELEPDEAIYNYQLGELLYTFRDELIAEDALEPQLLDQQMIESFAKAHILDPDNRRIQQRYGEAFFDLQYPNWPAALDLWRELAATSTDPLERQWATLQEARVLLAMGRQSEARNALAKVTRPGLQEAKSQLLRKMGA